MVVTLATVNAPTASRRNPTDKATKMTAPRANGRAQTPNDERFTLSTVLQPDDERSEVSFAGFADPRRSIRDGTAGHLL